ncbi:MAG: biopolymer transporter ExbD [Bacteroidetes bacterium]|nr:biopolymer transporter ExbD [Bacteroidota bacterium]
MKFEKKQANTKQEIPTASMPDIIFMLLFFFMVTTTLRDTTLLVKFVLPKAEAIEKIDKKRFVSYIFVGQDERIQIDDAIVDLPKIEKIMAERRIKIPQLIVSLRVDRDQKMGIITDIQQKLRNADALRVNYSAKPKEKQL